MRVSRYSCALQAEGRGGGRHLVDVLEILPVERAPGHARVGLGDGHFALGGLHFGGGPAGFEVAGAGLRGFGLHGLAADGDLQGLLGRQPVGAAQQQGVAGIGGGAGAFPVVGLLLLEQPELHLIDGFLVVSDFIEGFDEGGLGFGGGFAPVVAAAHFLPVHAQLGRVQGVFREGAEDFGGGAGFGIGAKCGQRQLGLQVAGLGGPVVGGLLAVVGKGRLWRRRLRPAAARSCGRRGPEFAGRRGGCRPASRLSGGAARRSRGPAQHRGSAGRFAAWPRAMASLLGIERPQLFQLAKTGHDELGDVAVIGHLLKPREGAVGQLHFLELEQGAAGFRLAGALRRTAR